MSFHATDSTATNPLLNVPCTRIPGKHMEMHDYSHANFTKRCNYSAKLQLENMEMCDE